MAKSDPVFDLKIDTAASGDTTIVGATAGQKIKIWSLLLWWNGTTSVILKDGATRNLTGALAGTAQIPLILEEKEHPWFTLTTGNAFIVNLSDAIQVSGSVRYTKAA